MAHGPGAARADDRGLAISGHSKWRDVPAVRRLERMQASRRLRAVALEIGAGWETADSLVIELDDGRIIKSSREASIRLMVPRSLHRGDVDEQAPL